MIANLEQILEKEISTLQQALKVLRSGKKSTASVNANGLPSKRYLSPDARKRIADAQKRRWAAVRKAA